eukprot:COSAG01_NODE_26012_length_726_cov_1.059011_1_plen_53_part_00
MRACVRACTRSVELGYTYLALLNPDLMVELAKQFLVHAPDEPLSAGTYMRSR